MKWTEIFMGLSFPQGFTCRVLWRHVLPVKTLSSGPKVGRFCEERKKARQGDNPTGKQNASPTVSKSRGHPLESNLIFLLSLLLRTIWPVKTKIWTTFSCYF